MSKPLSPIIIFRIAELHTKENISDGRIASILNISPRTVRKYKDGDPNAPPNYDEVEVKALECFFQFNNNPTIVSVPPTYGRYWKGWVSVGAGDFFKEEPQLLQYPRNKKYLMLWYENRQLMARIDNNKPYPLSGAPHLKQLVKQLSHM